jgi:hypothetical protein
MHIEHTLQHEFSQKKFINYVVADPLHGNKCEDNVKTNSGILFKLTSATFLLNVAILFYSVHVNANKKIIVDDF